MLAGYTYMRKQGMGRYCRRPSDGAVGDWAGDPVAPPETRQPGWFATCQPKAGIPPDQACLNKLLVNQVACYSGGYNAAGSSTYVLPKFNTTMTKPVYVAPVLTGNQITDSIRMVEAVNKYNAAIAAYNGQANMTSGNNAAVQKLPVQNSSTQGNVAQSGGSVTASVSNPVPVNTVSVETGFLGGTMQVGNYDVPIWMIGAALVGAFFVFGGKR